MTMQEIFDKIAELEEVLFYAKNQEKDLAEAHKLVRAALVEFHRVTGCVNE